ncbi:SDR family NAD(P)-dependent oxidoreductase [Paracoccus onubensis]|uniref:SDR family oxidoreductase n=1 Tax=Paracoccus onubensis TaxID=1675788 RepID=A0A418SU91_9RHOB|nr:SDR family oxidoreductase [Paracoccus onubensis]RJE84467.1 SDR family oxidoreductase [Paracoccus onubensis]
MSAVTAAGSRPLLGQVALVTGGVRRIGRATALALAGAGADIVINARNSKQEAEDTCHAVEALGVRAMTHLADVTDETAVAGMLAEIEARMGHLDILVNNAAIRREAALIDMTLAEWREIQSVILEGAFLCSRAALPGMVRRGHGRIINIGGVSAHTGAIERAHVAAAKAGLEGLTRAAAVEFAGHGITVNCVAPGKIGGKRSGTSGNTVSLPGGAKPIVPREGAPEDVAAMILTLCGPAGDFVTGQTIHVNGGLFLT